MQNPIKRYQGKNTRDYQYYAGDFATHRCRHWQSIYYQSQIIVVLKDVHSVLEFGGGRNTTRALTRHMGIEHIDVDVSNRFFPDAQSSILDYKYQGKQYDLVCSFECLEHNPFSDLDKLIPHMLQFSRKYFYISVPYKGNFFSLNINLRLPKISFQKQICVVPNWFVNPMINESDIMNKVKQGKYRSFHSPHWWEVGMKGLSRRSFIKKIECYGLQAKQVFHNPLMPYHLFCFFEKR